jgi:hypothetical protein
MEKSLPELFAKGLHGHNTHMESIRILKGISHDIASQKGDGDAFSSLEILFHTVFWQDICLQAIRGESIDWKSLKGKGEPSSAQEEAANWEVLCQQFEDGIKEAEKLLNNIDLEKPMPGWGNAPTIEAVLVLAQHNSYHLGQIVVNRRLQGSWPPPKEE